MPKDIHKVCVVSFDETNDSLANSNQSKAFTESKNETFVEAKKHSHHDRKTRNSFNDKTKYNSIGEGDTNKVKKTGISKPELKDSKSKKDIEIHQSQTKKHAVSGEILHNRRKRSKHTTQNFVSEIDKKPKTCIKTDEIKVLFATEKRNKKIKKCDSASKSNFNFNDLCNTFDVFSRKKIKKNQSHCKRFGRLKFCLKDKKKRSRSEPAKPKQEKLNKNSASSSGILINLLEFENEFVPHSKSKKIKESNSFLYALPKEKNPTSHHTVVSFEGDFEDKCIKPPCQISNIPSKPKCSTLSVPSKRFLSPKERKPEIDVCIRSESGWAKVGRVFKGILFGIALIVWSPCIVVVLLAWILTYPLRPHHIDNPDGNTCKKRGFWGKTTGSIARGLNKLATSYEAFTFTGSRNKKRKITKKKPQKSCSPSKKRKNIKGKCIAEKTDDNCECPTDVPDKKSSKDLCPQMACLKENFCEPISNGIDPCYKNPQSFQCPTLIVDTETKKTCIKTKNRIQTNKEKCQRKLSNSTYNIPDTRCRMPKPLCKRQMNIVDKCLKKCDTIHNARCMPDQCLPNESDCCLKLSKRKYQKQHFKTQINNCTRAPPTPNCIPPNCLPPNCLPPNCLPPKCVPPIPACDFKPRPDPCVPRKTIKSCKRKKTDPSILKLVDYPARKKCSRKKENRKVCDDTCAANRGSCDRSGNEVMWNTCERYNFWKENKVVQYIWRKLKNKGEECVCIWNKIDQCEENCKPPPMPKPGERSCLCIQGCAPLLYPYVLEVCDLYTNICRMFMLAVGSCFWLPIMSCSYFFCQCFLCRCIDCC